MNDICWHKTSFFQKVFDGSRGIVIEMSGTVDAIPPVFKYFCSNTVQVGDAYDAKSIRFK